MNRRGAVLLALGPIAWTLGVVRPTPGFRRLGPCDGPRQRLTLQVRDAADQRALANAELVDTATRAVLGLTRADGQLRVTTARRTACLLVRQIGFQPAMLPASIGDTVTVFLTRAVYQLEELTVVSSGCSGRSTGNVAEQEDAAQLLDQIVFSGARFREFAKRYPFDYVLERRTGRYRVDDSLVVTVQRENNHSSTAAERYRTGHVLDRGRGGFFVTIFSSTLLGDTTFIRTHCFTYQGVRSLGAVPVIAVSFRPIEQVREVDWSGTLYLDQARGILRRVDFELTNLEARKSPSTLRGVTTFRELSPFVVLADSTSAWWWNEQDREDEPSARPDVLQQLVLATLVYTKETPPVVAPADTASSPAGRPPAR